MQQQRRQRDGEEATVDNVAAKIYSDELPYDGVLITSIARVLNDDADRDRKDRFEALGAAVTNRVESKLNIATYDSTFAQFERCVRANNANPLRAVAATVVLINNNRREKPSTDNYFRGFYDICACRITSADFSDRFVQGWDAAIDCFRDESAFESFDSFVNVRRLKNRDDFPICERCLILCHNDDTAPLHKNRFLDSGVWIDDSSLLRRTSPPVDERCSLLISKFVSGVPNFIGGESGSGKTCAAMLAGSSEIVLYAHAKSDTKDLRGPYADADATSYFVQWIARCLQLPFRLGGTLPELQFLGAFGTPKLRTKWPEKQKHHKSILIVFDECGALPNLCRCYCRLWPRFRTWLRRLLCCEEENQIYLVMIGTDFENFEGEPPGSLPAYCQVFAVRAPLLFAKLLLGLKEKKAAPTDNAVEVDRQHGMKRLAKALMKLLYQKYNHHDPNSDEILFSTYRASPSDPATHRFLQLVSNPRCAALAVQEMRMVVDQNKNNSEWTVSLPAAAALLPWWSNNIARNFGQMNSSVSRATPVPGNEE